MSLSQHSIFSTANPARNEASTYVSATLWQCAKKAFSTINTSSQIKIENISFINLYNGTTPTLYACTTPAGGGSHGDIYHAHMENGAPVVIKLTDIDEITFPNADDQTLNDYDKLVSYIQTNLANNENSSAEEIILAQKKLLLNSGLLLTDDNYSLVVVMPDLGMSLSQTLLNAQKNLVTVDINKRLNFALQCIDEIDALHHPLAGQQNFIHGDISLANFVIDAIGKITLIDFGTAILIRGDIQDNYQLPPSVDERFSNVPPEYQSHRLCSVQSDVYRLSEALERLLLPAAVDLKQMLNAMRNENPKQRPSLKAIKEKILSLQNEFAPDARKLFQKAPQ